MAIVEYKKGSRKVVVNAKHKTFLKKAPFAVKLGVILGYSLDENLRVLITDLSLFTMSGVYDKKEEHRRINVIKTYVNKTYGLSFPINEWEEPETHEIKHLK